MYEFELVVNDKIECVFGGATAIETLTRYEHITRLLDDGDWDVDVYATYPRKVE